MNRAKLEELYDKYIKDLIYFINGYLHDLYEAEDIAEDVFVELLLHPDKFRKASSEKTYLFAIGKNKAIDRIRRNAKLVPFTEGGAADKDESIPSQTQAENDGSWSFDTMPDVAVDVIKREEQQEMLSAVSELKEEYRMAIFLSYYEGLSNGEIAELMNVGKKQVENYLYRGKQSLKEKLGDKSDDYDLIKGF